MSEASGAYARDAKTAQRRHTIRDASTMSRDASAKWQQLPQRYARLLLPVMLCRESASDDADDSTAMRCGLQRVRVLRTLTTLAKMSTRAAMRDGESCSHHAMLRRRTVSRAASLSHFIISIIHAAFSPLFHYCSLFCRWYYFDADYWFSMLIAILLFLLLLLHTANIVSSRRQYFHYCISQSFSLKVNSRH